LTVQGQPIRVLFCNITSRISGAEGVLLNLLQNMDRKQFLPLLCCPEGALAEQAQKLQVSWIQLDKLDIRFTRNPLSALRYILRLLAHAVKTRRLVASCNADLVHANSIRAGILLTMATIGTRQKILWHIHDNLPRHLFSGVIRTFAASFPRCRFLAVSRATRVNFSGRFFHAILWARSTEILNGINPALWNQQTISRAKMRAEQGITEESFCIISIGQIAPRKNQLTSIRAFRRILKSFPQAILLVIGAPVFAGSDAYMQLLVQEVEEGGLQHKVKFMGQRKDVADLLHASDLLLLNSLQDPCPLTILEAMAASTPILASNVDGIPELIEDGVSGWLVTPHDLHAISMALEEIMKLPEERRIAVGKKAQQRTRELTMNCYMEKYQHLLLSVHRGDVL